MRVCGNPRCQYRSFEFLKSFSFGRKAFASACLERPAVGSSIYFNGIQRFQTFSTKPSFIQSAQYYNILGFIEV